MSARTCFRVQRGLVSGKQILGLDRRDQRGLLCRAFRRNLLVQSSELVPPRSWRQSQKRVGERREQGHHGADAAQWTEVVRHRRSLLPDLFDRKPAKAVKLVVRPDDVHASGIVIRCSALSVGSPVQQRFRCILWFGHDSPGQPNRTVAAASNGNWELVLVDKILAQVRNAITLPRNKSHCCHRNPAHSCPCTRPAIILHSEQISALTPRGDRSELSSSKARQGAGAIRATWLLTVTRLGCPSSVS
ncbi:hypothetical protein SAMN04489732_126114 [Amycolatopsis saalfeldensis]|uniref:Uncharacterized protein n=1 Tax=Amycolatopsis saalfeldensis TaxID=394193 RepID=A0A1H8YMH7_9PSEU|nr:hypothetical protein SAMN04489732_126114 [Amycolatopsis saalfeldensis]